MEAAEELRLVRAERDALKRDRDHYKGAVTLCHDLASRFLERLGKSGHPDAAKNPVSALGQVAVDLQQALNLVTKKEVAHVD